MIFQILGKARVQSSYVRNVEGRLHVADFLSHEYSQRVKGRLNLTTSNCCTLVQQMFQILRMQYLIK